MSALPQGVAPNEVLFYFETNDHIPIGPLLDFLSEIERIAHTSRHFGPDCIVEIASAGSGSFWIRLAFWTAMGGAIAEMSGFGLDIAERLSNSRERVAQCVATLVIEHGVVRSQVITCEGSVTITRDGMASVRDMEASATALIRRVGRDAPSSVDLTAEPLAEEGQEVNDPQSKPDGDDEPSSADDQVLLSTSPKVPGRGYRYSYVELYGRFEYEKARAIQFVAGNLIFKVKNPKNLPPRLPMKRDFYVEGYLDAKKPHLLDVRKVRRTEDLI